MKKVLLVIVALAIALAPILSADAYQHKNKLRGSQPALVEQAQPASCPMMQQKGKDMKSCPCMKDGKCQCMKDGKCPCMKDGKCDCKMCKDGKCPCMKKAKEKGNMCPLKKEKK